MSRELTRNTPGNKEKRIKVAKLYNAFLSLDNKSRKELFKVNEKVNGNINLAADKISWI